jgi:hypothetical protein
MGIPKDNRGSEGRFPGPHASERKMLPIRAHPFNPRPVSCPDAPMGPGSAVY